MANYVGEKIREARTAAGLTMTALADSVDGVSAADIGKAERGEKELTQAALKQIAKATGVTQKSLLEAAAKSSYGTAKKAAAPTAKKTAAKTTAKTTAKSPAKADGQKLTKAETELLELYRAADKETKAAAVALLKGEEGPGFITELLSGLAGGTQKKASKAKKDDDQGLKGILGEFLKGI